MSRYNLERLGWANFECLVRVLLRELLGAGVSTFSGSADQARDAVFEGTSNEFPSKVAPWSGQWVIQSKYRTWGTRGIDPVRAELKQAIRTELDAVLNKYEHNCNYYLFVTNCPLTATNKDELKLAALSCGTLSDCAVLGEADIEELLTGRHHIARAFPAILGQVELHELLLWGITQRSAEYLRQIQTDLNTFVVTAPYLKALDVLRDRHFCVLTGPPKMGKSCTANAMLVSYAASGFSVHELRSQQELYESKITDEKQVFLCDDVFGDIALKAALRDEWTRKLGHLLRSLDNNHKLIWTARSYILKAAIETSRLKEERPELEAQDSVTIAVDALTNSEKAQILYNHAKRAGLSEDLRSFLRSRCYEIATHAAYSPESIRQLCSDGLSRLIEGGATSDADLLARVSAFLTEPGTSWKQAYSNAPHGERLLCMEVMASGGTVPFDKLKEHYTELADAYGPDTQTFEQALEGAEGTFLRRRTMWDEQVLVGFYHPTMRDLLGELLRSDRSIRRSYIARLSLSELTAVVFPQRTYGLMAEDSLHRIQFDQPQDVEAIEQHLIQRLLPACSLGDLLTLLSQLADAVRPTRARGTDGQAASEFTRLIAMLVDRTVEEACEPRFFERNGSVTVGGWRLMIERLCGVLTRASRDFLPKYCGALLDRVRDYESVDFWGLVVALAGIVPTIVKRHVECEQRSVCRVRLSDEVQKALEFADGYFLEDAHEERKKWHDEYANVIEECRDFESLFEDEQIPDWDKLEALFEKYPRDGPERDLDDEREYPRSMPDANSRESIKEMFRDL